MKRAVSRVPNPRATSARELNEPKEPEANTVERWAWDYVMTTSLAAKLSPPPLPSPRLWETDPPERRIAAPGRPPELRLTERADKVRGLRAPSGRARALHTFLHHELQAAELMAWALLAFPETPIVARRYRCLLYTSPSPRDS